MKVGILSISMSIGGSSVSRLGRENTYHVSLRTLGFPRSDKITPSHQFTKGGLTVATSKQRSTAKRNVKKAATAAKRKQTLKRLPKKTRTALGKQAAKTKKARSRRSKKR